MVNNQELCKLCKLQNRSTCEAQKLWDSSDTKFRAALQQVRQAYAGRQLANTHRDLTVDAIRQLKNQRAQGAAKFRKNAAAMGCTILSISDLAE